MQPISRNKADYQVWTPVTIRYSDQDPMQHVNNVATVAYLESGRSGLLREIFGTNILRGQSMVLANVTVDFLHEMRFPGTVDVGAKLVHVGGKSLTAEFAIFQGETCCVTSKSTNVFFDPKTRRSTNPSPEVRAKLTTWLS